MDSKMSDRLQAMVRQAGAKTAPVKVRLRAGLSGKKLTGAVKKLQSRLGGAEYLAISGTVHGTLPLDTAETVAGLPEVEWMDVEPEVPIEELIDPG
jgi:hypothetical protein